MMKLSTREAAKKLGIEQSTLAKYITAGKVPTPETAKHGTRIIHLWTEEDIERVRKILPTIANGRKTRYSKLKKQTPAKKAKKKAKP